MTGSLAGKRIVLGVTGGIAAYKAIEIARRLVDAGAHVVPIMTEAAQHFVGTTTLSALASEPVKTELWHDPETPIPHTKAGQGADLILVAPATAKLLAAYRIGYSHDLLLNTLIATRAPVVVCPAMHTEMWEHPSVVDNVAVLRERGVHIVEPDSGRLAGGDVGAGRLAEPERIVAEVERVLGPNDLDGVRLVVSAGGTREPIDSVRVIANRSSGKQGYAVAAEALARGASVTIVSTVSLPTPPGAVVVPVETAAEMHAAMNAAADDHDVVVMAAAVADFRPASAATGKIKKRDGVPEIVLEPTPDILAGLGENKRAGQVLVGFAAETDDLIANATSKLEKKRLDLIVANDVGAPEVGFAHDTNAVTLLRPDAKPVEIDLAAKRDVARAVIDTIVDIRRTR
ncbi:bifunctional phosphopantothenoylcysteine decarboxylase/phosphopantothenate--cysteine ligase CoaBC [Ilumatobacter coccineus]|uniref:Coenzyme A biosynthesis bifunctional protein CoaBC n=1 Tax=Ilumatobacter coccineus (strain NBRC 103263 / KCTC 29153 / YM16-304) TaxID=1313172 RepID=A0A6C7EB55_ILUCY|nr:bifunctional phosphopantothenoylcysteine decarboxylase/phosphopantothenate--cysteine ligase CoaBC [Ilumatobacter coccineus]BAN02365.1 phosphopantothenoylcysteine decarboxylase/phosphopantothenate--cysteine ligase [Ilumatobacter coccineus YM16-304]